MTPRQFTGLAIAAAVSVATATLFYGARNKWTPGSASGEALMPALATRANDIASVQVSQGDKTLTIERKDDAWRIKERDGYLALPDKVRTLVLQLAQAKLAERKTQRPQRHATLELEDPVSKDAKSRMVRLLDGSGRAIGEVIVGKSRFEAFGNGKPGIYVRRPTDAQTWLAVGPIDLALEARDWVNRAVFESDKISAVSWHAPGTPAKESLKIKRKSDADPAFELDAVPTGKKIKGGESAESIARAYARIELDDVRRSVAPAKDTVTGKATVDTADGVSVAVELHRQGDENWLALSAKGDGEAKAKADALNARLQGWQFKVSPATAGQLFKTAAELFETS
jgi:Domain of unknown function (DUF4340)